MTDALKKFISDAQRIALNSTEKSAMRETLVSFIASHPVSSDAEPRQLGQRSNIVQSFMSLVFKPMSIVLIIALLFGGSASFAAEQALPGDMLYSVKVGVNEEVRGWIAFTPEAKASWEARRAERRLLEAERLASRGKFNAQAHETIEGNFEAHADRVSERANAFSEKENFKAAADVSARFETSLKAHERILEKLSEKLEEAQEPHQELDAFARNVGARLNHAANARVEAEEKVSGDTQIEARAAAEGKLRAAENKIAEVRHLIERAKVSLGAEATLKAEARLQVAEERVTAGKIKMDAGAYGEAFVLVAEAHQIAQEGKLLIEARRSLQLNIDLNGTAKEHGGEEQSHGDKKEEAEIKDSTVELETEINNFEGEIESESETSIEESAQTETRGDGGGTRVGESARLKLGL